MIMVSFPIAAREEAIGVSGDFSSIRYVMTVKNMMEAQPIIKAEAIKKTGK
jgi:hypothetical protein